MPRLDLFTLSEQVRVAFLVAHLRSAKVKPLFRLRVVGDGHLRFLVRWNRLGESDDHFFIGHLIGLDFFRGGDGMDLQVHGIEFQFLDRSGDGFESNDRLALDGAQFEVRRDIQRQVQSVNLAVGRVFPVRGRVDRRQKGGGLEALDGGPFRLGAGEERKPTNSVNNDDQANNFIHSWMEVPVGLPRSRRPSKVISLPTRSHAKFTGSTSTVSDTSSGKVRVSRRFASDRLSLLICRVRSMI